MSLLKKLGINEYKQIMLYKDGITKDRSFKNKEIKPMRMFLLFALMAAITSTQAMESGLNFVFKSNPEITITSYKAGRIRALLKEGDYTETVDASREDHSYVCYRENCLNKKQIIE